MYFYLAGLTAPTFLTQAAEEALEAERKASLEYVTAHAVAKV